MGREEAATHTRRQSWPYDEVDGRDEGEPEQGYGVWERSPAHRPRPLALLILDLHYW